MDVPYRYFLVEGGPLLDIANKYRAQRIQVMGTIANYVKMIGAEGYRMGFTRLSAVKFPIDGIPVGFCKPDKYRCCVPKKGTKYWEEFKELPELPDNVYKDVAPIIGYVGEIRYQNGMRGTGSFEPITFYYYDRTSPLLLRVADIRPLLEEFQRSHPGVPLDNPEVLEGLKLEGLREVLEEEWNLIVAQLRKMEERSTEIPAGTIINRFHPYFKQMPFTTAELAAYFKVEEEIVVQWVNGQQQASESVEREMRLLSEYYTKITKNFGVLKDYSIAMGAEGFNSKEKVHYLYLGSYGICRLYPLLGHDNDEIDTFAAALKNQYGAKS